MTHFDYANATLEDAIRERDRRNAAGVGQRVPPRRTPIVDAEPAPAPDDGVRCATLPWSMLVTDNHKHTPQIRGKRAVLILSTDYREAKKRAQQLIRAQLGNRPPLTGRLAFNAVLIEPNDHTRRDLHNYGKLVMDVLTGIAYEDDSQIDEDRWSRGATDIDAPRLAIRIHTLGVRS